MADISAKEESSRPLVICLAAGLSQKPVIERALALGFFVVGVDRDPQAPAGHLCHRLLPLSTHEPIPLIQALRGSDFSHRIVGVLNRSSGPPVVTAAAISEAFELPGVPVHRARQCLHKDLMREECSKRNLFAVNHQIIHGYSDLAMEKLTYPCVVKPALSMVGKQGISVVENAGGMEVAVALARDAAFNGKVLVEEYLEGSDISVIALVNRGQLEILAILDEINQRHPDGSISGRAMAVPSKFSGGPEELAITELTREVVKIFEIEHSALLLSCRVKQGEQARLMEIHLDLGGDKILDVLLPVAGSFDTLEYMIAALAGNNPLKPAIVWQPTAVIFDEGDGLISQRNHKILQAGNRKDLEDNISRTMGEVIRP